MTESRMGTMFCSRSRVRVVRLEQKDVLDRLLTHVIPFVFGIRQQAIHLANVVAGDMIRRKQIGLGDRGPVAYCERTILDGVVYWLPNAVLIS